MFLSLLRWLETVYGLLWISMLALSSISTWHVLSHSKPTELSGAPNCRVRIYIIKLQQPKLNFESFQSFYKFKVIDNYICIKLWCSQYVFLFFCFPPLGCWMQSYLHYKNTTHKKPTFWTSLTSLWVKGRSPGHGLQLGGVAVTGRDL